MNIEDSNVYRFLKLFTFIDIHEINEREKNSYKKNQIVSDKVLLAKHMTRLVHGDEKLSAAERITNILFFKNINDIQISDLEQLRKDGVPVVETYKIKDLQEALVLSSLAQSRTQAKNMIISNSISINTKKIVNKNYIIDDNDKLFNQFTLLSRGKKNHCLIYWNK
jgi:tyrosyl-tRNA synthetase